MVARTRKKPTKPKQCKCCESVNKQLLTHGLKLDSRIGLDFDSRSMQTVYPLVAVVSVKTGKLKGKTVVCNYCPFCGVKK
jgi:hypothetical protein